MANNTDTSELGQAIQEITETATLLVREEIELAKTEVLQKATKLITGAVVGIIAGIFAVFALIYLLHSLAFGVWAGISDDANYIWVGYLVVGGLLLLLGGLAAGLAVRFMKGGAPPTPEMAIEEGKLIKETLTSPRPAQPHDSAITPAGTRQPERQG
jgi:uncharacterized membrane protein YqjE